MPHPAARTHGYRLHGHTSLGSTDDEALSPAVTWEAGRARVVADGPAACGGIATKWPDDILCDGARLAGILVEGRSTARGPQSSGFSAVLGFGVNCASHPTDLSYMATPPGFLAGETGTRDALFAAPSGSVVDTPALQDRGGISPASAGRGSTTRCRRA